MNGPGGFRAHARVNLKLHRRRAGMDGENLPASQGAMGSFAMRYRK
jgi:hypothetical protein